MANHASSDRLRKPRPWRWLLAAAAIALFASGCSDSPPDWRAELIELSQSEHSLALHYPAGLDESNTDSIMQGQCLQIERALANGGDESRQILHTLFESILWQLNDQDVPVEIINRDLTALGLGMAEICEPIHGDLVDYFGFDDFTILTRCTLGDEGDPGAFCQNS